MLATKFTCILLRISYSVLKTDLADFALQATGKDATILGEGLGGVDVKVDPCDQICSALSRADHKFL